MLEHGLFLCPAYHHQCNTCAEYAYYCDHHVPHPRHEIRESAISHSYASIRDYEIGPSAISYPYQTAQSSFFPLTFRSSCSSCLLYNRGTGSTGIYTPANSTPTDPALRTNEFCAIDCIHPVSSLAHPAQHPRTGDKHADLEVQRDTICDE